MAYAVVKKSLVQLYRSPGSDVADELLFGMVVELLSAEQGGYCRVRTAEGAEGYLQAEALQQDEQAAKEWQHMAKMAVRAPWLDVLQQPNIHSTILESLPRGGMLRPMGQEDAQGWLAVALPCGRQGFARKSNLMPQLARWDAGNEKALREALAASALSYLGTQYRSAGRTALGIDAHGLVAMAYLLNGCALGRVGSLQQASPLKPIEKEQLGMGDVIFFAEHVALYLGEGRYVHSTPLSGSDGVVISSLQDGSPFFRKDLADTLQGYASLF